MKYSVRQLQLIGKPKYFRFFLSVFSLTAGASCLIYYGGRQAKIEADIEVIAIAEVVEQYRAFPVFNSSELPPPPPLLLPTQRPSNNSKIKTILIPFPSGPRGEWGRLLSTKGRKLFEEDLACEFNNCQFTIDRARLQDADAVIFHYGSIQSIYNMPRSKPRLNQRWIFLFAESPEYSYDYFWGRSRDGYRYLNEFVDVFNWTMTYRLDSDIRMNYGRFFPITSGQSFNYRDRLKSKSKSAVILTSDYCDTPSRQIEYAYALKNAGLDVDFFGGCVKKTDICGNGSNYGIDNECFKRLSKTYKFFLAFENSICRDYITENFYRAAMSELVPVVLNGADMSLFAPPKSYINTADFETPADLAMYLLNVGSNATEYNAFFWWKRFYDVELYWRNDASAFTNHFCQLCEKLNTEDGNFEENRKAYRDIESWWMGHHTCEYGK